MYFHLGDRVMSTVEDFPGLEEGELGTVVKIDDFGAPVISWDEYNDVRHSADGAVAKGHGWFVDNEMICHASPTDLGELPENRDLDSLLFNM